MANAILNEKSPVTITMNHINAFFAVMEGARKLNADVAYRLYGNHPLRAMGLEHLMIELQANFDKLLFWNDQDWSEPTYAAPTVFAKELEDYLEHLEYDDSFLENITQHLQEFERELIKGKEEDRAAREKLRLLKEKTAKALSIIAKHGELGSKVIEHFDGDLKLAQLTLEVGYNGCFTSLEEYAYETVTAQLDDAHYHLKGYIDFEKMARDMEMGGDFFTIELDHKTHVFSNHY